MSRPFRITRPVMIAAGLALGLPLIVAAQPAGPHVEAGLWETGMDMGGFKMTNQICMDGSEAASRRALAPPRDRAGAERECEKQDIHPIPGGYSVDTVCTSHGRKTHVSGTVTGDFRTHYKTDMTVETEGRPPQVMRMDSRRIGVCPAGMKAGEVRMQMDPNAMAGAMAAARARGYGGEH